MDLTHPAVLISLLLLIALSILVIFKTRPPINMEAPYFVEDPYFEDPMPTQVRQEMTKYRLLLLVRIFALTVAIAASILVFGISVYASTLLPA